MKRAKGDGKDFKNTKHQTPITKHQSPNMTTFYYGRFVYEAEDPEYNAKSQNDTLFPTEEELIKDIMMGGHFVSFFSDMYNTIPRRVLLADQDKEVQWKEHNFVFKTVNDLHKFCELLRDDYSTLYFEVLKLKLPTTKRERGNDDGDDNNGTKKAKITSK